MYELIVQYNYYCKRDIKNKIKIIWADSRLKKKGGGSNTVDDRWSK